MNTTENKNVDIKDRLDMLTDTQRAHIISEIEKAEAENFKKAEVEKLNSPLNTAILNILKKKHYIPTDYTSIKGCGSAETRAQYIVEGVNWLAKTSIKEYEDYANEMMRLGYPQFDLAACFQRLGIDFEKEEPTVDEEL